MSQVIRLATIDDVDLILRFVIKLAEYERLADAVRADRDILAASLFGDRPAAETLIVELDGKPVGMAMFFHNFSTFEGRRGLYLEDLFVEPEARGSGIGKALLKRLAQIAIERDCARFEWAVLDWNEPAIGFYRALGAVGQDEWTIQRLEGEALSRLALS